MDVQIIVFILVGIYSIITTLAIIGLAVYICIKKNKVKTQDSEDLLNIETIDRKSVPNKYDERPISEYDMLNCKSKTVEKEVVHHVYEDVKERSCQKEINVIHYVADIMAHLEKEASSKTSECDYYKQFLQQLLNKIRSKNPILYEKLTKFVTKEDPVNSMESDNEVIYARYVGTPIENRKSGQYGSKDHLQFLYEDHAGSSSMDLPYLQPKQYNPKTHCPENLKELCRKEQRRKHKSFNQSDRKVMYETIEDSSRSNTKIYRAQTVCSE